MRLLLISLFISSFLELKAQEKTLFIGPEIELRQNDEYQGLIHADTSGYTIHIYERSGRGILGQLGRRLILEKYDTDLELVFSYEYGTDNMISLELEGVDNGYIWVVMEKVAKYRYTYSMIPISLDGVEGKKQKLFTREINKAADIPFTYLKLSPDSTSSAFVATFDSDKKRRQAEIYTAVFGQDKKLIWDKFFKLKGNQKDYNIQDYILTQKNELLLLSKCSIDKNSRQGKRQKQKGGADYSMQILKLNPDVHQPKKSIIELDGTFVNEAVIRVDPNSGYVLCSGMTSNKDNGNINGIFFARYDEHMEPLVIDQKEFSILELIKLDKADADVNIKKGKSGLDRDYGMVDMYLLPDGTTAITIEENYVRTNNNNFNRYSGFGYPTYNNTSSTYLYSNDIVSIIVSEEGQINDIGVIPKKQTALMYYGRTYFNPGVDKLRKMDLFLSHGNMVHDGHLFFMFNDHEDNLERRRGSRKVADRTSRMETVMVEMIDGKVNETKPLVKDGDIRYLLSPTRSKQIDNDTYFMSLMKPRGNTTSRSLRIGIMSF